MSDWTIDRDGKGEPVRLLYSRPSEPVGKQLAERQTRNEKVRALFLSKPNKWISALRQCVCAGFCSWRTRVSEVRVQLEAENAGTIQWNEDSRDSRYRYLRQIPQGPDASVPRERKLFY